jgi:uncharacterized protein YdcH (DUF465 family)
MEGHHHHLAAEFPEFKDKIHELKLSNAHFVKLNGEYEDVDKKIARSEARIELLTETEETALRKKRLLLKEELYTMLKEA